MQPEQLLKQFDEIGVLIKNTHVVYTSGRHGNAYVNKDAIYPYSDITSVIGKELAQRSARWKADVVIAPAMGAIILSQWVAYYLSEIQGNRVASVYAEKLGNGFVLKRGYDKWVQGRKVMVVEDVVTTGGSIRKLIDTVRPLASNIVGVAALWNRGGITAVDLGVQEFISLLEIKLDSWSPHECPLCIQGVPIRESKNSLA